MSERVQYWLLQGSRVEKSVSGADITNIDHNWMDYNKVNIHELTNEL
jgi:hypothetical protein